MTSEPMQDAPGTEDKEDTDGTSDDDLLREAKANYKIASEWWDDNRKAWLEDTRFRAGDQWPEAVKKIRSVPGQERPCLVVDKINQYIRQVVNDGRQNRPSIKVRPIDDGADEDAAAGFQGLFRHILNRSNADEAFDTALDHAATGGFGYFRVLTEYAHEQTFNQEIVIRRVRNALAVLLAPHQAADASDAAYGFFIDEVPKDEFKKQYPKAQAVDWTADGFQEGWASENAVRVCEYFYKVDEQRTLYLLEDGTSCTDEEYKQAQSEGVTVPAVQEEREIPVSKVHWCRLTGCEILEKQEWLGKYIPIIPVYGNEIDIEGKVYYSGLIRSAKDAQRLYNYSRSAFAERVALTPKAPWLTPVESTDDFVEWQTANSGTHQRLRYKAINADDGKPIPPPQRISAADVPAGFAQDMQMSEHDIQSALGMYAASVGQPSNEKSGRAIMARQKEGDTATFHYQDNQSRAIRYLGRILLDLAPKVYDAKRVVRILGEDGKGTPAQLDPTQQEASKKLGSQLIYNLNVGTYDVEVEAGPSYTTKRMEAADAMMQMTQGNPQIFPIIGDLMVKAMDWPNAEAISERLHAMLPPPILQAEQDKASGTDPEVAAVKQQAQQIIGGLQQQIQDAEQGIAQRDQAMKSLQDQIEALRRQVVVKGAEVEVKDKQADTQAYDAETRRLSSLATAFPLDSQGLAQIVQQAVSDALATHITQSQGNPQPQLPQQMNPQPAPAGFLTPGGS